MVFSTPLKAGWDLALSPGGALGYNRDDFLSTHNVRMSRIDKR